MTFENSPSKLAAADQPLSQLISTEAVVSAESRACAAPLTTKLAPGSAWKVAGLGQRERSRAVADRPRKDLGRVVAAGDQRGGAAAVADRAGTCERADRIREAGEIEHGAAGDRDRGIDAESAGRSGLQRARVHNGRPAIGVGPGQDQRSGVTVRFVDDDVAGAGQNTREIHRCR